MPTIVFFFPLLMECDRNEFLSFCYLQLHGWYNLVHNRTEPSLSQAAMHSAQSAFCHAEVDYIIDYDVMAGAL